MVLRRTVEEWLTGKSVLIIGCARTPRSFADINFRPKGFPVSDFQYGDGYTESQRLM